MMRNNFEASSAAMIALKLDPDQSNAYYVLSVLSLRSGSFGIAYERAKRAIEIDPTFAVAYKVKSDALVGSFSKQASTVILSPEDRYKMLEEAADDLESYIRLSPARKNPNEATEYLESIKFFAEYYRQPENLHPTPLLIERTDDLNETPLRILTRPRATYTNSARNAGVQGTVLLRVAFMASGKIRHIMVVKPLEASLDRQAILAAQRITFEPAKKNGVPISVVKQVEYSFTIF
ncbi:MAG: TonB family protein [Pyrinomonadaceae bacterium]